MSQKHKTSSPPDKASAEHRLEAISQFFDPQTIAQVNDTAIKLAKLKGEFIWHYHENEDELFLVLKGKLLMKFRNGSVWLEKGEFIMVPRGVEHCPVAPEEVHILLVEPLSTKRTGNVSDIAEELRYHETASTGRRV